MSTEQPAACGVCASASGDQRRMRSRLHPTLMPTRSVRTTQPDQRLGAIALVNQAGICIAKADYTAALSLMAEAKRHLEGLGAALPALLVSTDRVLAGRDQSPRGWRNNPRLTPREHEVLDLLVQGQTDEEIGAELFISRKTASVHVANIKGKLGANSRVGIVTGAIRLGLAPSLVEALSRTPSAISPS